MNHFAIKIKALVLAGGHSQRMKTDKGELVYHQKPQKYHVADMLERIGLQTFISQRKTQNHQEGYNFIFDSYKNMGLMAGLLSAFDTEKTAWLCVGCDYPLLDKYHLLHLMQNRDDSKMATVIKDLESGFLIPTLALYEPSIEEILRHHVEKGEFSLQKILQNQVSKVIEVKNPAYKSIDKPTDYEYVKQQLQLSETNP